MKIYKAKMPEVYGYGFTAYSTVSEEFAKDIVREAYIETFCSMYKCTLEEMDMDFEDRWDYYGGYVDEIEMGKIYRL